MANENNSDPRPDRTRFLMRGFQISRMLRLVADLGLADRITAERKFPCTNWPWIAGCLRRRCFAFPASAGRNPHLSTVSRMEMWGTRHVRACCAPTRPTACTIPPASGHRPAPGGLGDIGRGADRRCAASSRVDMGRFDYLRTHPDEARVYDTMMAHFPMIVMLPLLPATIFRPRD